MRTLMSRCAICATLTTLALVLGSSCSSQESIEERRKRALSTAEDADGLFEPNRVAAEDELVTIGRGSSDGADSYAMPGDLASGADRPNSVVASLAEAGANGGGQDDDIDDLLDDDENLGDGDLGDGDLGDGDLGDGDLGDGDLGDGDLGDDAEDAGEAPSPPRRAAGGAADTSDVLSDLKRDLDASGATSKYYADRGDAAAQSGRYEEAKGYYRQALDADPSNTDVVRKLHDVQFQLGERAGDAGAISRQLKQGIGVRRQQLLAEIDRNIAAAEKAISGDTTDVQEALDRATLAVDQINQDLELAGKDRLTAARSLLDSIRRKRAELKDAEDKARQNSSQAARNDELDRQAERREERIQELLHRTLDATRRREFRKAKSLSETILEIDPGNKLAQYWLRTANERLFKERQLRVIAARRTNERLLHKNFIEATIPHDDVFVFPEDEYWQRVRQRRELLKPVTIQDSEPVRQIKAALESTIIDVVFEDSPLDDVIAHFRSVVGINILIDPNVDKEEIKVDQPINQLVASSALRLLLESKDLGYTFRDNIMVVTTADEAVADTNFEAYNVSDLLTKVRDFVAPELRLKGADEGQDGAPISFSDEFEDEETELDSESLIDLIKDSSGGEDVWDEETNTINFQRGQLFVKATGDLHQKVQDVLANLREDSDLYVVIEARFIDITDDFLEDIGVDSRELSDRNWDQVVPFGGDINDASTGGNDLGLVGQGNPDDNFLASGLDRWAGRVQHVIDGFTGAITGERITGGNGIGGGSFQATWLEPFQVNVIVRAVQEKQDVRQLTAPVVTAHNNERVYVSVITQRAYIADYELVSGGTGFAIIEVADPVVQTFQEGVILDVDPTISHDKKYVTLDVKPTLATLIGGIISTINISLGSFTNVAFQVPIGIPQISLQQAFTSVTVPNGGTVLLGGFKGMQHGKFNSYLPIIGKIPILKNLARRKATISEKRSLVILLTARIVDLRGEEERRFNPQ